MKLSTFTLIEAIRKKLGDEVAEQVTKIIKELMA